MMSTDHVSDFPWRSASCESFGATQSDAEQVRAFRNRGNCSDATMPAGSRPSELRRLGARLAADYPLTDETLTNVAF